MPNRSSGRATRKRIMPQADSLGSREGLASQLGHATSVNGNNTISNSNYLRRSDRIAKSIVKPYIFHIHINHKLKCIDIAKVIIPKTHRQAKQSKEWEHWAAAERAEIEGIIKAGCISERFPPPRAKIIDSKWVFSIKSNSLNQIVKFKARLSARGDQLPSLDIGTVFAPVVGWLGIRYFMALTVRLGLRPLQLDFDLAYLNALERGYLYEATTRI